MEIPFWLIVALGIIINVPSVMLTIIIINATMNPRIKRITLGWPVLILFAAFVVYWCFVILH